MGAKDSKPCCITYEEAVKRVTDAEQRRLRDAFKRASNLSGVITKPAFIKEVLGEFVPIKLAEHIYQACGGTQKGITFKDLLCGLVLLTNGYKEEKIKFIFSLYANELGTHVTKDEMVRLVQASDGGYISEAVADCFTESDKVSFEEFRDWLYSHPDATSLTKWLLSEPCSVSLFNDLETPTFYQTLAGVTHLEESDIIELEKRYWSLKSQSRTGKFDLETLAPLIHPPVPLSLCEGIFNAFDENRDGHIDFKEMACGISACCKGPLVERQKFCFKIFDQDQDGSLCKTEAYSMVLALLHVRSENIYKNSDCLAYSTQIDEIVSELFSKFDTNKDNTITLDEYLVWSVDQTLPLDLLNLLFQVCHIVFGLKPTRKEEEGDIVRNWLEREERRGLKVGQLWFLISMDWWKSWNEYIDYQDVCSIYAGSGTSSLKRSNKLQKRVDSSLAQTLGDGNSNVTLSSIVTLGEDALASLNSNSSSSSTNSSPYLGYATNDSLSRATGESIVSQMRTLHTPEIPRTPSHSPGMVRKLTAIPPQRPPSIDNASLVVPSTLKATILTGEGGKLKKNTLLMRGRDFEVVPEAIWRALFQWYGGSPSLPRQVILPQNAIHSEIELYPITLKLFKHHISNAPNRQPGSSWTGVVSSMASAYGIHPFFSFRSDGASANVYPTNQFNYPKRYLAYLASFSRMATLRQVYDFLCVRLKLRPEDTRLWLYKDDNNLSLLDEEYLTLEQMDIEDNEQVLIEIRNKDLTWPEEMSNLLNAKLDQKHQGPTEKGATGLNNLGNTCFMNAALQCVSNTRPLTLYFINDRHLYELNRTNPLGMKGHIAKRYGDLVQELWSGTSRTIAPLKLRWTIGKYAPRFNGFQQHDSQELLAFLLDGLHEDLNRVHEKPYVELKDSDGRPDADVALEAWENHILRNRSIIVDLFHGQLQSSVTCKVCGHISVRFDPFNYLSLPLPMESCVHTEVIVMKLDGSVPVKYGLRLNHDDKYSAVKQQLSSHCHLSPNQIVLTEVSSSMIKAILSDDQKIRMVMGTCLYAYEIPVYSDLTTDDEVKFPKEPQTLTQIQRMGTSGKKTIENGVSTSNSVRNVKNSDDDGKVTFKVGADYGNDSPGPSSLQSSGCDSIPCVDSLGSVQYGTASSFANSQNLSVAHHSGPQMNLPTSIASSSYFSNHSTTTVAMGNGQSTCSVSNSVPAASLANARCGSSSASSLSSSLVSNSSAGDLVELARKRFVIAYHRKMNRQEVYFLSSQKTRPALFGLPLVLPCSDGATTHQDLYQMVWMQVSRLVSPLPPSESSVPNHAQDCDDSLGYEYPFILKVVQKDGVLCAWCPWFRFCRGCQISCGETVFKGSAYIAIDWDPTALHLRYQAPLEKDFINHESVEKTRRQQTEPIDLHACLEAFTKEEHLGEEEKYYCSKCKDHQLASKKLQIWRLPPILIVHLKRFQLLNGRWVKSQKIVRFPFENFEPKEYLAKVPKSTVLLAAQEKLLKTKNLNNNNNVSRNESGDTSSGGELIKSSGGLPELNGDLTYNNGKNSSPSITRANSKLDNCRPTATAWESPRKTHDVQILNCEDLSENIKIESTFPPATLPTRDSSSNKIKDFHRHKLLKGYNPYDLRYKLYAIACHSGILGGGHYVSYACNPNNRWYCYNDSSCKEVQPDQLDADSAYMLFYEREGVDYEAYLPNVEGRVQDTKEIDDEFESDFRKMCSIQ